jgi:excisionase family DNA binding protein
MTDQPKKSRSQRSLKPRQPGEPFTAVEVADVLRVSVDTVALLCRTGKLRAMRIGGRGRGVWRIDESDLDAYREKAKEDAVDPDGKPQKPGPVALRHIRVKT